MQKLKTLIAEFVLHCDLFHAHYVLHKFYFRGLTWMFHLEDL